MKKFLAISALFGFTGCASLPFFGPPVPTTPATPVFFQPDSAVLDQTALTTISTFAQAAAKIPDAITITGDADQQGALAANEQIAHARADIVAKALIADGVGASRIRETIRTMPTGDTPANKAQAARRVLLKFGD